MDFHWTYIHGLSLDLHTWTFTGLTHMDFHWTYIHGLSQDLHTWTFTGLTYMHGLSLDLHKDKFSRKRLDYSPNLK